VKNKQVKIVAVILYLLTTTILTSCSPNSTGVIDQEQVLPKAPGDSDQSQKPPRIEVSIENFAYYPDTLDIPIGTTVIWYNNDSVVHSVTARDDSFDSGTMYGGGQFSHTFNKEGVFEYYCIFHSYMTGEITVK